MQEYEVLAEEIMARLGSIQSVDRDHLDGVRLIRRRIDVYLAEQESFDRSGVVS